MCCCLVYNLLINLSAQHLISFNNLFLLLPAGSQFVRLTHRLAGSGRACNSAALHDSQFKKILLYLTLGPSVHPLSKQAVLSPIFKVTFFWLVAPHKQSEQQVGGASVHKTATFGTLTPLWHQAVSRVRKNSAFGGAWVFGSLWFFGLASLEYKLRPLKQVLDVYTPASFLFVKHVSLQLFSLLLSYF